MSVVNAFHLRPTHRADEAWFGDPVPFFWDGVYHLFYVWDQGHLRLPRVSHAWAHFSSRDLVHWEEHPMAFAPEPEASCGTGSIIEHAGQFHAFYLGRYFTPAGVMYETMCHATSRNLVTWEKDDRNPISLPDTSIYSVIDWRDGFPIWDPAKQQFMMLVTASLNDGPEPLRGCLATLWSKDLQEWAVGDPFWAPQIGREIECPDLFEWNGWWYLVYSGTFGHSSGTLYRRSRSMYGPWETPPVDTFDGPLFYAGKTAGDADRRMLFGWLGTREGDKDSGRVQWGGHALMREVVQDDDGYLWVKCPAERLAMGSPSALGPLRDVHGKCAAKTDSFCIDGAAGAAFAVAAADQNYILRFRFRAVCGVSRFGVIVRSDEALSGGYRIGIDLLGETLSIVPYGRLRNAGLGAARRSLQLTGLTEHTVTVVQNGSILEVFVNDRTALVGRFCGASGQHVAFYCEDGQGEFHDIALRVLPAETW